MPIASHSGTIRAGPLAARPGEPGVRWIASHGGTLRAGPLARSRTRCARRPSRPGPASWGQVDCVPRWDASRRTPRGAALRAWGQVDCVPQWDASRRTPRGAALRASGHVDCVPQRDASRGRDQPALGRKEWTVSWRSRRDVAGISTLLDLPPAAGREPARRGRRELPYAREAAFTACGEFVSLSRTNSPHGDSRLRPIVHWGAKLVRTTWHRGHQRRRRWATHGRCSCCATHARRPPPLPRAARRLRGGHRDQGGGGGEAGREAAGSSPPGDT